MGGYSQLPIAPYRPAENDPMASLGRLMQMRGMMQSQQLQQQEIQQREQQNQLTAQQLKDQQLVQQHLQSNPGSTFADAAKTLRGQITLPTYEKLMNADADIRQKNANATDKELENGHKQHAQYQEIYNNVMNLPDEQVQAQWPQIAQAIQAVPGNKINLDPQQPLTKQQLQQFAPMLTMNEAYLNAEREKRQQAAKLRGETATAEKTEAETAALKASGGMSPLQQEARYRFVLQKLERGEPVGDDDMAAARAFEASKTERHTTSDSLGVTSMNATVPGGLAAAQARGRGGQPAGAVPVNPAGGAGGGPTPGLRDSVVDEIGQYKASPMLLARMMAKHPEILGLVGQKYPDWNQPDYNAKNKMVTSYTSGPQSKEINAINTAMGHIKVLDDAVAALNNGSVQALNAIANKLGAAVGADPQTTFRTIVHRVGPEITSAYIPGAGGEAERLANAEDFSEKLAPNQLHSNAAISVKLLRSKVGALENQYKNTIGRDDFNQRFITPEARAAFDKFGGQQGGGAPTGGHIINVGGKRYQYKGSGDTADLKNYSEIAK